MAIARLLKVFNLFILGCAGSLLLLRFSVVVESRGYSLVAVPGLLIKVAPLVAGSMVHGFSSCDMWAQQLQFPGLEHRFSSHGACA